MRTLLLYSLLLLSSSLSEAQLWEKLRANQTASLGSSKTDLIRAKLLQILQKRVNLNSQRRSAEVDGGREEKQRLLLETIRSIEVQRQEAESQRKESELDVLRMKETLEKEKQDLELLNRKREIVNKALMKQAEIARTKKTIIEGALARRNKIKKAKERLQEEMLLMRQMEVHRRKEAELERLRKLNRIKEEKQEELRALQAHKLLAKESNDRMIQKISDLKSFRFFEPEVPLVDSVTDLGGDDGFSIEALLASLTRREPPITTPAPKKRLTKAERQKLLTLLDLKNNAWILAKNNQKIAQKFKSENALLSSMTGEEEPKSEKLVVPLDDYDYESPDYSSYNDYGEDYNSSPDVSVPLRNHPPNLLLPKREPRPNSQRPPNLLLHKEEGARTHHYLRPQDDFSREAQKFFQDAALSTQKYHKKIQAELNIRPMRKNGRPRHRKRRKGFRKTTSQKPPASAMHPHKKLSFSDIMSDFLDKDPIPFPIQ